MKKYDIVVTVNYCIEVEAENEKQAIELAEWDCEDYSYTSDVMETEIMSVKECEENEETQFGLPL